MTLELETSVFEKPEWANRYTRWMDVVIVQHLEALDFPDVAERQKDFATDMSALGPSELWREQNGEYPTVDDLPDATLNALEADFHNQYNFHGNAPSEALSGTPFAGPDLSVSVEEREEIGAHEIAVDGVPEGTLLLFGGSDDSPLLQYDLCPHNDDIDGTVVVQLPTVGDDDSD